MDENTVRLSPKDPNYRLDFLETEETSLPKLLLPRIGY